MNKDMQEQNYPKVKKIEVKENFHGTTVIDNYRWMEDHREPELVEWVEKQNHLFHNFIDDNSSIKKDLEALFNYTRYGMPIKKMVIIITQKIWVWKNNQNTIGDQ